MGMTMAQKILAAHAGRDRVEVGDVVVCEVDRVVQLDISAVQGARIKRVADPARVSVIFDHTVPAPVVADAIAHQGVREFVREFGIEDVYDVGDHGICHQVILERGLALPGNVLACADSHTIASGVFNCAARGLGPLEIAQIICTGRTWYRVSPTVKVTLTGAPGPAVFGKDVFLHLAGEHGSAEGHDVEFGGSGLRHLSLDDRATLATMCAEISANFALFPADELILEHLRGVGRSDLDPVESDADAEYAAQRTIALDELVPYVAKPDFVPGNTLPVGELGGPVRVDQAFIGSCANGKLEDLRIAAGILDGQRVHRDVRLIVTPASQRVYLEAVRQGYVETLVAAGAVVTNSTCGACYGGHMGVVAPGEVCVTSSTRNFKGRMGSAEAEIYIGSSATVAAAALEGAIVDPTEHLMRAGVGRA